MKLQIRNETSKLKTVILGRGDSLGDPTSNNPMEVFHKKHNTYPKEIDITREIVSFEKILKSCSVEIYIPSFKRDLDQIFTRDIGFVIEDTFFISNMGAKSRQLEIKGIDYILDKMNSDKIVHFPSDVVIEGGNIILWNKYIFVGLGRRTNRKGVLFLKEELRRRGIEKEILSFELSDYQGEVNEKTDDAILEKAIDNYALHLDCIFQPIGKDEAILYEKGFKKKPKELLELFPEERLIEINKEEKNAMVSNIFSISPSEVIIENRFVRLKKELERRGYTIYEVDYKETSKLCGLLRCSTLPLFRE